ncbi:MAG: CPBP family intramembrane metalloprotease [Bacteroidetes bacterium]|nr:CPBP family intramembrane metalloprotease [Bacteroidota bacterium]
MTFLISEIISAILQILVFTLIPFIVYLIIHKTSRGFLAYIGLVKTTKKAILLSVAISFVFIAGTLVLVLTNENTKAVMTNPPSVTGKLHQMGLSSITMLSLFIIACFKTSFAEEIFFRGFVAKRLMKRFGYLIGNITQSLIFAVLHLVLFAAMTNSSVGFLLYIFLISGIGAYLIGLVKEKYGEGSIIPGWIAHGLGNTISYFIIAFVI